MDLDDLKHADPTRAGGWDTPEIESAIAALVESHRPRGLRRRRGLARITAVGVAAAASVTLVGHLGSSPGVERTRPDADRLVRASFERAASAYPLPAGSSYEPLRRALVSGDPRLSMPFVVASGRMPSDDPAKVEALVRRYAECRWVQVQLAGTFDTLTPAKRAEAVAHTRAALARLGYESGAPKAMPITRFWDELCKDDE